LIAPDLTRTALAKARILVAARDLSSGAVGGFMSREANPPPDTLHRAHAHKGTESGSQSGAEAVADSNRNHLRVSYCNQWCG
jgi:hypothetical protein